jgi:glycosyltransferase involved in cell wall biosynthesis
MDYPNFTGRANRPDEIERQLDTRTHDEYTVTAIVSTYASTHFLPGLLDDLISQTLYARGELEIVFVDSHSPEDDWSIIEAAARDHEHIRAIRTVERETLYTAWSRAIAEARGRYISNANTDDRHRRDAYELLSGVLDVRSDVALVYSNTYVSRVENEPFYQNPGTEPFTTPAFFAPNQLLHFPFGAQPMWRKSVHDHIGVFDGSFKAAGDWDFAIRFAHKFRALHVEEVLGSYLVGENTISFRDDTVTRENTLVHGRIHNPETAYALYHREGLALKSPQEKAQALVDLGVRAMGYRIPYGTPKNKLPLAVSFFAEATRLAPDWAVAWNNLAVALAVSGQRQQAKELLDSLKSKTDHPTIVKNAKILLASLTSTPQEEMELLPSGLPFPNQEELQKSKVGSERSVSAVQLLHSSAENGRKENVSAAELSVLQLVDRLRNEGIRLLHENNLDAGVAKLDEALDYRPFDTWTHDTLRKISLKVEDRWQKDRDHHVAGKIRETQGAERLAWIHRSGQFQEAPESMTTIWDAVCAEITPQSPDTGSDPLVTIVLTTHNHEHYLEEAFRSVIAQTFRNWELVIVNDASTDGTSALIERLISEHKEYRITSLLLDGAGPARARNTGVQHGTAPYLLLLDGDDILSAQYIEYQLPVIERDPNLGWVFPVSVQAGSFHRLWSKRPFDVAELAAADRMPVNSLMRREMFSELGGFSTELVGAYEDWDLWLRAVRAGWKAKLVPEALFLYRKVSGSRCDFNGQPEAPEIEAKKTMIRRVPEFYLSAAVDHPVLNQMLRIHPEIVDEEFGARMERRFAANEPPDHPATNPELPAVTPTRVVISTLPQVREEAAAPTLSSLPEYPTTNRDPVRILFYFFKNVHIPVLLPVFHEMRRQGGYEIAFFVHGHDRQIRAGLEAQELEILQQYGVPILDNAQEWNADVSLMADNVAFHLFGCGKIVNVGHGLLSKGQYFTDTDMIHRENLEDLLCVPGPYHKQRLSESGRVFIPVVATGFPKLDRLFDANGPSREELMRSLNLDPAKRTILFAPTFNMTLSSIPILWMRVAELADENTYLLIKLHSSSLPEFKSAYRELAEKHKNVIYAEDPDITNLLRLADVMLSDVSSVFMEFMALDKPVVLFDNPNQSTYRHYDPRDIEYAWRDVGVRASTLDEVKEGVRRGFENPGEFSEKRRAYAEQLLANRDGSAAGNVIQAIHDLLDGHHGPSEVLPDSTVVLMPVRASEERDAGRSIKRLIEGGGEHAKVFVIDQGCDRSILLDDHTSHANAITVLSPEEVHDYKFDSDYTAVVRPGIDLGERRLFRLVNHLRRSSSPLIVAPLLIPRLSTESPEQNAANYIGTDSATLADPLLLDRRVRAAAVAQLMPRPVNATPHVLVTSTHDEARRTILERAVTNSMDPIPGARVAYDVAVGRFSDNREMPGEKSVNGSSSNGSNGNGTARSGNNRLNLVTHYENKGNLQRALQHARKALDENSDDSEAKAAVQRLEQAVN